MCIRDRSIAKGLKLGYAGHVVRETEPKWSKLITFLIPVDRKRRRGRPNTRWVDDLVKEIGTDWHSQARDRASWRRVANTYAQKLGG